MRCRVDGRAALHSDTQSWEQTHCPLHKCTIMRTDALPFSQTPNHKNWRKVLHIAALAWRTHALSFTQMQCHENRRIVFHTNAKSWEHTYCLSHRCTIMKTDALSFKQMHYHDRERTHCLSHRRTVIRIDTVPFIQMHCDEDARNFIHRDSLSGEYTSCPSHRCIVIKTDALSFTIDALSWKWTHCPSHRHTILRTDALFFAQKRSHKNRRIVLHTDALSG